MRWPVAQSGFECLDLFRRAGPSYDLVLTDLSMPLMDGEETFERLRQIAPAAKVVLMAGFVDSNRLEKNDEQWVERVCRETVRAG
jgi:CheY-like chemotaxis protein